MSWRNALVSLGTPSGMDSTASSSSAGSDKHMLNTHKIMTIYTHPHTHRHNFSPKYTSSCSVRSSVSSVPKQDKKRSSCHCSFTMSCTPEQRTASRGSQSHAVRPQACRQKEVARELIHPNTRQTHTYVDIYTHVHTLQIHTDTTLRIYSGTSL